jgi:hypothetical protein
VAEAAFEQWRRASGCQGASRRYLARVRTEGVGCGLLRRSSPSLGMIAISWRYRVRLERILSRKCPEGRRHLALGGHATSMGSRVTLWPSRSSWRTSCRW